METRILKVLVEGQEELLWDSLRTFLVKRLSLVVALTAAGMAILPLTQLLTELMKLDFPAPTDP